MGKPILCVDFDGVIHSYSSGWQGPDIVSDPPVAGALRWLWRALDHWDVQIYSSRSKHPEGIEAMRTYMVEEGAKEFGMGHPMGQLRRDLAEPYQYPVKFVAEKPAAFLTIDDRAICFDGDWSALDPADLLNFKPWNKRG